MNDRNVTFINELRIEFTSNGRRKQRNITRREAEKLKKLIDNNDKFGIDNFCYSIV